MAEQERTGIVTMRGNPLTLIGPALKHGDKAPDFQCVAPDLTPVTLASSASKARLLISVPSLDTPVCSTETIRFNREVAGIGGDTQVSVISMDLPFAQRRFGGSENIANIQTLSDHREASFGRAYGVLIKELRLLARAWLGSFDWALLGLLGALGAGRVLVKRIAPSRLPARPVPLS